MLDVVAGAFGAAGAVLVADTGTDDATGDLSSPPFWVPTNTATASPTRATSSATIGLLRCGAISGTAR